jgi:nitroimidazol reductase NimA-like FMN-containing flavoprotein (pyridoxamine 5'-phosphate oxidase superfamily)
MCAAPHTSLGTELESLSEAECLRWLQSHQFGRVAIVVDGRPLIFPVNYAVSRRVIAIRTALGTKLTYAPGNQVAFEIDGYDPSSKTGWSVLVQGRAVDATVPYDDVSWRSLEASPRPAAPGKKLYRLAIFVETITGRRFGPLPVDPR